MPESPESLRLYRQALELNLKLLVGEGSNFLKTRTDPISLSTTHSLRWLALIVCQIIRAVKWEREFTCEGVSSFAGFSALVSEVESYDHVARAIRSSSAKGPDPVPEFYRTFKVFRFAMKLDALLDLLHVTADALAATWDQRLDQAQPGSAAAGMISGRRFSDDLRGTFPMRRRPTLIAYCLSKT